MPLNAVAVEIPPRAGAGMAPLYELSNERARLLDIIDQLDELAADDSYDAARVELAAQLDALDMPLAERVAACAAAVRNAEAEKEACSAEAKRFQERAGFAENRATRIKSYLMYCLRAAGIEKVLAGPFRVGIANNGGRVPRDTVRIENETEQLRLVGASTPTHIPGVYLRTKIELVIDDALLPDEYRLPRSQHVTIR